MTRFKIFLVFSFQADLIWTYESREMTPLWSGWLASDNGLCDPWKPWGEGDSESNEELLCHLRISQYTQETFVAGPPLA